MAKRSLSMLLAMATLFALAVPALAEEEPAPAEEPVIMEEPVVTEEPVMPEEPVVTEEAVVTEEPVVTEEAVVTEEIVVPEEPIVIVVPEETAEPEETVTPDPVEITAEPEATAGPEASAEPIVTEEPLVTEEPVGEPETTEIPEPVEEPETAALEDEPMTVAETASGTCGDSIKWSFSGGTLTISGKGKMKDYFSYDDEAVPWYSYQSSIKNVVIKSGVTNIGYQAFRDCKSLTSVTIPDSVTSIGGAAFFKCTALHSVTIPNSVTSIGGSAFFGSSLDSVTIPKSVTTLGDSAFEQCAKLTSITIPGNVTSISGSAFRSCSSLKSVTILDGVTSIKWLAFESCGGLTSVTIPSSVKSIDEQAFSACSNLTSITVLNPNCEIYADYEDTLGIPSSTVVYGYDGSTAETYAKKWGYTFRPLDKAPTPAQLAAPSVSISAATNGGIKVSWNKVSGSPRYMVYYKENGGSWHRIGTTTAISYTRSASKLKSGVKYQFTVRCCASDKKTLMSSYKASNSLQYLATPKVKISATSNGGIKVSWNKVSGAPRYAVYYKENGGSWHKIGTTTATSYTRSASKLRPGVKYQFTVRCCMNDKKTMLSGYTASNSLQYLATPKVTISATSSGGIKVSWNKVSGAPRYMVYYKENGGAWHKIGTTTATSYTRSAYKLRSGVKYQFTVRCCMNDKKTVLSGYTASNSLQYLSAPYVSARQTPSKEIIVTWDKVEGADCYMVYYREYGGSWQKIGATTATSYTRTAAELQPGHVYEFTVRCCANDKKTMLSGYRASGTVSYFGY